MEGIKDILKKAENDKDVLAVALFGSSLKSKGRDIDICLFLNKKLPNLKMSKKRLEYLKSSRKNIDIQIFQQLPIYVRVRIVKECKVLFCKNDDLIYDISLNTLKEFSSYEKLYKMYLSEMQNG